MEKKELWMEMSEYDSIKEKLVIRVVNEEFYRLQLEDLASKKIGDDMFAVFNVVRKGGANLPIFKEDLENWGISIDTLWEDAIKSSPNWKHPQIWNIYEFMGVPTPKGGSKVHFISDKQRDNYGAACIFAKGYLQEVAEILGSDLYIIPSSINECIVLPENAVPVNRLTDMLHEVNGMAECVPPDEKLSDFIYHYDREKHTLEQCEATTNVVVTL